MQVTVVFVNEVGYHNSTALCFRQYCWLIFFPSHPSLTFIAVVYGLVVVQQNESLLVIVLFDTNSWWFAKTQWWGLVSLAEIFHLLQVLFTMVHNIFPLMAIYIYAFLMVAWLESKVV